MMNTLESALRFSPDDLAENRQGRLSEQQRSRLAFQQRVMRGCALSSGLLIVSLILLFISRSEPLVMLIIVLSTFGLLAATQRMFNRSAPAGEQVMATTGILSKHMDRNEETYWYHVTVRGTEFNVNPAAYEAFVEGERYTLYHLPGSPVILSVEAEDGSG